MTKEKRITGGRQKGWAEGEILGITPKIDWFVKNPFDGNVYQKSSKYDDMFVCSVPSVELAKLITLFPQAYMLAKSISFGQLPSPESLKQLVSDFETKQQETISTMSNDHAKEIARFCTQDWIDSHPNYWALFESAKHITDKLGLEDISDRLPSKKSVKFINS